MLPGFNLTDEAAHGEPPGDAVAVSRDRFRAPRASWSKALLAGDWDTSSATSTPSDMPVASAISRPTVVVAITRVLADAEDPAFADPTKFIGPIYDECAVALAAERGGVVKPDGDHWRRVVASPDPTRAGARRTVARSLARRPPGCVRRRSPAARLGRRWRPCADSSRPRAGAPRPYSSKRFRV